MILIKRDRKVVINRLILSLFMGICSFGIFRGVGEPLYLNDYLNYRFPPLSDFFGLFASGYNVCANIVGALLVLVLFVVLANSLPYILVFAIERPVFIREYSNGLYSIFPYYFVKIVSDLPVNILSPLMILPFIFWTTPLAVTPCYGKSNVVVSNLLPEDCPLENTGQIKATRAFWMIYGACVLAAINSLAWALLVGAYAPTLTRATTISQIIILPMILFSGVMVNNKLMPKTVRWMQWLDPMRFSFEMALEGQWDED